MPRSIQEIQADMARVQAAIDERNTLGSAMPEYRAARFDYVVDGDRSGLDAMLGRVAASAESRRAREAQEQAAEIAREFQAEQNRLNRESSERMHDKGLAADRADKMYQWQKDMATANAMYRELMSKKSSPRDIAEVQAELGRLRKVGLDFGYIAEGEYSGDAGADAQEYLDNMAKWEEVYPDLERILNTEGVSSDELREGKKLLDGFVKVAPLHKEYMEYSGRLNSALEKNRVKDWNKLKGDIKGRIADPKSSQKELAGFLNGMDLYSDQADYEPTRTEIAKAIANRSGIPQKAINRALGMSYGEALSALGGKTNVPVRGEKNMYLSTREDANGKLGVYYMGKTRLGTFENKKFKLEI